MRGSGMELCHLATFEKVLVPGNTLITVLQERCWKEREGGLAFQNNALRVIQNAIININHFLLNKETVNGVLVCRQNIIL